MILSDQSIKEYIADGRIIVVPECKTEDIRPAGIRLHLDSHLMIPVGNDTIDLKNSVEPDYTQLEIPETGFELKSNAFILGSTVEKIQVSRTMVGKLDGRSTLARLGISFHCSSDVIDGNYEEPRSTVLEIKNIGPHTIVLHSRMPVGMIVFHLLDRPIEQMSQSQYRNQEGVRGPNLVNQLR